MKSIKTYLKSLNRLMLVLEEDLLEMSYGNITIDFYFFEINISIN